MIRALLDSAELCTGATSPASGLGLGDGNGPLAGRLVRIMSVVENPGELGSGIALAFVATIYGLGLANFVLLPLAGRMEARVRTQLDDMELIIEGACALARRDEPNLVERTLATFAREQGKRGVVA